MPCCPFQQQRSPVRPNKRGFSLFEHSIAFPLPEQRFYTPKQKIGFSLPKSNRCFKRGRAMPRIKKCLVSWDGLPFLIPFLSFFFLRSFLTNHLALTSFSFFLFFLSFHSDTHSIPARIRSQVDPSFDLYRSKYQMTWLLTQKHIYIQTYKRTSIH